MEIGYKQIKYELVNPFFAKDDKHAMEIVFGLQQILMKFMPDMPTDRHSCGICSKEKTDYEIKQHEDNLKKYAARMVKVLHPATQSYVIRLATTAEAITEEFKERQQLYFGLCSTSCYTHYVINKRTVHSEALFSGLFI